LTNVRRKAEKATAVFLRARHAIAMTASRRRAKVRSEEDAMLQVSRSVPDFWLLAVSVSLISAAVWISLG
jgi:hypothetical protein